MVRTIVCLGICQQNCNNFKETTLNHAILMGRVTFDGMGRRLLPKRETLILTRNPEEKIDGVTTFMMSSLSWTGIRLKTRISIFSVGSKFSGF